MEPFIRPAEAVRGNFAGRRRRGRAIIDQRPAVPVARNRRVPRSTSSSSSSASSRSSRTARRLPLTNNVVVDQTSALGLIDELRVAVPEEVRAAKRINSEGERIIEKAQEEAERIVARAQEQAAFLIDERGLTQQAEAESRRIIGDAEADAEDVRRGADEYAVNVLVGLEGDVVKTLQSIKSGIDLLDARRSDLRADEQNGDRGARGRLAGRAAEFEDEEAELPVRR